MSGGRDRGGPVRGTRYCRRQPTGSADYSHLKAIAAPSSLTGTRVPSLSDDSEYVPVVAPMQFKTMLRPRSCAVGARSCDTCDHRLGMSAATRLMCVCALCAFLAACGGSGGGAGSDRQQIQQMFSSVDTQMAKGDYASACSYFSQRQQANITAGARKAGLKVSSCAEALMALIKVTGITRAQLAQTFGGAAAPKLDTVSVRGNQATVTFTDSVGGHPYKETDVLVRENGQWKADRIVKRTNTG